MRQGSLCGLLLDQAEQLQSVLKGTDKRTPHHQVALLFWRPTAGSPLCPAAFALRCGRHSIQPLQSLADLPEMAEFHEESVEAAETNSPVNVPNTSMLRTNIRGTGRGSSRALYEEYMQCA